MQGAAALVWIAYGTALHATPVIVANVVVAALALWSSLVPDRAARGAADS